MVVDRSKGSWGRCLRWVWRQVFSREMEGIERYQTQAELWRLLAIVRYKGSIRINREERDWKIWINI